jgi:hypothetical protein
MHIKLFCFDEFGVVLHVVREHPYDLAITSDVYQMLAIEGTADNLDNRSLRNQHRGVAAVTLSNRDSPAGETETLAVFHKPRFCSKERSPATSIAKQRRL